MSWWVYLFLKWQKTITVEKKEHKICLMGRLKVVQSWKQGKWIIYCNSVNYRSLLFKNLNGHGVWCSSVTVYSLKSVTGFWDTYETLLNSSLQWQNACTVQWLSWCHALIYKDILSDFEALNTFLDCFYFPWPCHFCVYLTRKISQRFSSVSHNTVTADAKYHVLSVLYLFTTLMVRSDDIARRLSTLVFQNNFKRFE